MRSTAVVFIIIPSLLFCALKVGAVEKEERKWQDESMYYIMVDRFMDSYVDKDDDHDTEDPNAYHGGDLQGIIEKLDYIKKMGFTSIVLSPIMNNGEKGYHGYWVEDFMAVEENFGTMADAKELVKEAHKRDINVLFDFIINYTGKQHPWLSEDGKQDWYKGEQTAAGEDQEQVDNERLTGLPQLNLENPEVKQYLFDAAEFWIKETDVDGFRINTGTQVPNGFWKDFSVHVDAVKEDFFLLGDQPNDDSLVSLPEGMDALASHSYAQAAREVFKEAGQSLDPLYSVWQQRKPSDQSFDLIGNFLNSHNITRLTRLAIQEGQNPITRLKLGLTSMFTFPGFPIMYYGTEVPLDGDEVLGNLEMMDFKAGNKQLAERIENLTAIRKQYPAITRGSFKPLHNQNGLAIFKRSYQDQTLIIAINNAKETRVASVKDLADDQQLTGLLHDGLVRQQEDGTYKIGMERETADVFLVEEDKGYNWLFIGFVIGVMGIFVAGIAIVSYRNSKKS